MAGFWSSGRQWPAIIVGMLLLNVSVCAVTVVAATRNPKESAVEPNYYQKAVEWDKRRSEWTSIERVGWRVLARIEGDRVRVEARDADGAPVEFDAARVEMFHHATPGDRVTIELDSSGLGEPIETRAGDWTVLVWLESGATKAAGELTLVIGGENG